MPEILWTVTPATMEDRELSAGIDLMSHPALHNIMMAVLKALLIRNEEDLT
jgi:hypothetical protein